MSEIPDGLYDNQANLARESYVGGNLYFAMTAEMLMQKNPGVEKRMLPAWRKPWGHYPDAPSSRSPATQGQK